MKIAAVGDIHVGLTGQNVYDAVFAEVSHTADVLVLTGDLTNSGHPDEADVLCRQLKSCTIPVVAVLGNHDFDMNRQGEITQRITASGVNMLDGDTCVIHAVGFVGLKGFGGGFGRGLLTAFGEPAIKAFVQEAVDESLKIEKGLSVLETERKIVVMHYAPIEETLKGEPEEIYPFMGTTRLSRPVDLFGADVVFHGHAHHGSFSGKTPKGIPVFNVALNVLQHLDPPRQYYTYVLE